MKHYMTREADLDGSAANPTGRYTADAPWMYGTPKKNLNESNSSRQKATPAQLYDLAARAAQLAGSLVRTEADEDRREQLRGLYEVLNWLQRDLHG